MVNWYAEDPLPAIESAQQWIPAIDKVVKLYGRYEGFRQMAFNEVVFESEHAKRNAMLEMARPWADPHRWLLWLDCDERVTYASPQLHRQLIEHNDCNCGVLGLRFIQPLPPDEHLDLAPALGVPGRSLRDRVTPNFPGRLFRHLPTLEYRHRHDFLIDTATGTKLMGWAEEGVPAPDKQVDLDIVHLWWWQSEERRAAKAGFYQGPRRSAESDLRVGRNVDIEP